jgi:starvation-inducible DNA-binding protein
MASRISSHDLEHAPRRSSRSGAQNGTPSPLATPTDLGEREVQAITAALNPLVADAFALYIKLKNFHWHLSGPNFRDYHLMFDDFADEVHDSIDILAERVRRVGGTTIRSVGHIANLTRVADDDEALVPPAQMLARLVDDHLECARSMRHAIEVCEKNHDPASASVLENLLDQTEKRKWFLFEATQKS